MDLFGLEVINLNYNETSSYPDSIDDRIFLSDINITQIETLSNYRALLNKNKYTEASKMLKNSDIDALSAGLFNMIENRIYATQQHLLNKQHTGWYSKYGVDSPFCYGNEPITTTQTPIWIE